MDDLTSRFLDSFATIEKHLRRMLDANRSATFNELLERAVSRDITPAAKKVIYQPEARARDPVRFPRWRVGLICSSMRNFLAGVIDLSGDCGTS